MQVQVYATPAAFDQDPAAFHRTTFLFISPQAKKMLIMQSTQRTAQCMSCSGPYGFKQD